jgi:hypothetical protein
VSLPPGRPGQMVFADHVDLFCRWQPDERPVNPVPVDKKVPSFLHKTYSDLKHRFRRRRSGQRDLMYLPAWDHSIQIRRS